MVTTTCDVCGEAFDEQTYIEGRTLLVVDERVLLNVQINSAQERRGEKAENTIDICDSCIRKAMKNSTSGQIPAGFRKGI